MAYLSGADFSDNFGDVYADTRTMKNY